MEEYCQKNWNDDPTACSEYIVNGYFQMPKRPDTSSQPGKTPSQTSEIIKLSDDNITIILAGLVIIIVISIFISVPQLFHIFCTDFHHGVKRIFRNRL